MSRQLVEGVHVAGRSFAAGDVPPEEYAVLITNPRAWGDPVDTDRKSRRTISASAPVVAAPSAPPPSDDEDDDHDTGSEVYDPSAPGQGLDEVNNYLANADEDEVRRVLAAEADGKARKGILEGPYALDDPED